MYRAETNFKLLSGIEENGGEIKKRAINDVDVNAYTAVRNPDSVCCTSNRPIQAEPNDRHDDGNHAQQVQCNDKTQYIMEGF